MRLFLSRYKQALSRTLARYFPHTTAYLRASREESAAPPNKAKATARDKTAKTPKPSPGKRSKPAKPRSSTGRGGIYTGRPLSVSAEQCQAMRARVAQAVAAGLIGAPSQEQWAMIECRAPLTRVFAGAGSGKSTTLLLRVVFMLCHLGIDATQLTVISFTNASCQALRQRLQTLLRFWDYTADVDHCVRTFHAAMAQLAREHLPHTQWFELLEHPDEEPDNPLTGGRLHRNQDNLLKDVYQQVYTQEAEFRSCLGTLLDMQDSRLHATEIAPAAPRYRLVGEWQAAPLYQHLYHQGEFAQCLGIDLATVSLAPLSPFERAFIQATTHYHAALQQKLSREGLCTFNLGFAQLTEALTHGACPPPPTFQHLLIDEFQDISPQIVRWLTAIQRQLARNKAVSLMAIGDDWQSIYGWRGSSPQLFLDFDRHFPSKGSAKCTTLVLSANYRSNSQVVRDAQQLVRNLPQPITRQSRAMRPNDPRDHGVKVIAGFDLSRDLPELMNIINEQCQFVRSLGTNGSVLLLARRNDALRQVRQALPKGLPIKAMTIHRAKGLEADVAIILDDASTAPSHPLRNALYQASGLFPASYDQAMFEEATRLAYVAVTRGARRVIWLTRKAQGPITSLSG